VSIRCVRGDQGSACPEGLGSASWRQKGPRRGRARWVWSGPVGQNGTPASAGSLPGTGDWAPNRAWRARIMSFPLWTMDCRGIRRGWAEWLPLASGRFCPFLGRKPGHSRCLGSSANPRILLWRPNNKRAKSLTGWQTSSSFKLSRLCGPGAVASAPSRGWQPVSQRIEKRLNLRSIK